MKIVTDIKKLREPAESVIPCDNISEIVSELFSGLKEFNALGLSANQLGHSKRVCVIRLKTLSPICIINPEVTKPKGSRAQSESCLSLPDTRINPIQVRRPEKVTLKGLNQYHIPVKYKLRGQEARIACHEVDHLNGKLIIDYIE